MKKTITESQLRQIVKESVKKALMEGKAVGNCYYKDVKLSIAAQISDFQTIYNKIKLCK